MIRTGTVISHGQRYTQCHVLSSIPPSYLQLSEVTLQLGIVNLDSDVLDVWENFGEISPFGDVQSL